VVHHGGKDEERGPRGHTGLLYATDLVVWFKKDDQGNRTAKITRAKEGKDGDVHAFRLKEVVLGEDADGDPIGTAVAVEAQAPQAAQARKPLAPRERKALGFLHDLLAREGRPLPASLRLPPDLRGTTLARWRAECERRGLSTSEVPRNKATSIADAMKKLVHFNAVAVDGDLVWAVKIAKPDAIKQERPDAA
jgi:hypothetical protein